MTGCCNRIWSNCRAHKRCRQIETAETSCPVASLASLGPGSPNLGTPSHCDSRRGLRLRAPGAPICSSTDLAVGQTWVPQMACPGKWKKSLNLRSNSWWFHFDPYPKHGLKPAVPWFSVDPYPSGAKTSTHPPPRRPARRRARTAPCGETRWELETKTKNLSRQRCPMWPWVKIQIVPSVNIPIPTKID